jgi:hypothetical protein
MVVRCHRSQQLTLRLVSDHFDKIGQVLDLRGQLDHKFGAGALDRNPSRYLVPTRFQLFHALPCIPNLSRQFPLSDLEAAHRSAMSFEVSKSFQTILGLKAVQSRVSLPELGIHGGPLRIGDLSGRVIGFDGIVSQSVQANSSRRYLKKFSCLQRSNIR